MHLSRRLRTLATTIAGRQQPPAAAMTRRTGTVTAIDVGAAADGSDVVTVKVGGSAQLATYLDSYTARAVDDEVEVVLSGGSLIIYGRIAGRPVI